MIHPDKGIVSLDDLKKIKLKRPLAAGERWKGVHHHLLVSEFMRQLDERGYSPRTPVIDVTAKGQDVAFFIDMKNAFFEKKGIQVACLGIKASNSGLRRMKLYAGGKHGDLPVVIDDYAGVKYDVNLSLEKEVKRLIDAWIVIVLNHLYPTVAHLLSVKLSGAEVTQILTKIVSHSANKTDWIIPPTSMSKVALAFAKSHQKTAFAFVRAVRAVIDKSPGHRQMEQSLQLFFCLPRWGINKVVSPATAGV